MPTPSHLWQRLLLLAFAGAIGTLARFAIYAALARFKSFPYPTLTVNVLGSFLFGLIWSLGETQRLSAETRILLLTGFMGAFTTFSTFAFETGTYLQRGQYAMAATNLVANNVLGILAFLAGIMAVKTAG